MSINRGMDKDAELWMDLETGVKNEVSQKDKNKYCILMHICGIQKNGIDDFICKTETESQNQRTNMDTKGEGEVEQIGRLG